MGRKPKTSRPSFFKVLIKDYTTTLRLPHAFVEKYGEFLPQNAKLRANSGEIWDVKLEEIDDDDDEKNYCFTDGWKRFAKDLELKLGEFLVFWFDIGKSTFDVWVYGVGGCEREISAKSLLVVNSDDADEDLEFINDHCQNVQDVSKKRLKSCITESEGAGTGSKIASGNFDKQTHPCFEIVLTDARKWRVCIPKKFAEAAGLIGKRAVVLEWKQKYWAVILDNRSRGGNSSLDMVGGWNEFRKENELMIGKAYSFEFDPTKNVIQVKEQKKRKNC